MWKAAAAFIVAIGAGGFVAGSVLGDPGNPPGVGDPIVLESDQPANPQNGDDRPSGRPADDDGTKDRGGRNDDDKGGDDKGGDRDEGPDTVYHEPDDVDDDHRDDDSDDGDDDRGDDDN